MTYSHSEQQILKGCLALMQHLVDDFAEYLDFLDVHPETEEEQFCLSIPYSVIVQRLFLWNTKHSGGTSTGMKCRNLGIKDHSIEFRIEREEE